ncbi:MAG: DUF2851 family protein [bacterium]
MYPNDLRNTLKHLGQQWLERKKQRMSNLLKIALPDEALYREVMLSLGYPKNKIQFLELALLLPYSEIKKLQTKELIERALLYRAGFSQNNSGFSSDFDISLRLDRSSWVFYKVRPANFPDKRIKEFSYLLSETTEKGIYNYFKLQIERNYRDKLDQLSSKKTVKKIMSFKGIGMSRKREMFFNIIIPFFLVDDTFKKYSEFLIKIFETHPPLEENSIIKKFYRLSANNSLIDKISNVKEYFGAIQYVKSTEDE